jgi:hypothetical protein
LCKGALTQCYIWNNLLPFNKYFTTQKQDKWKIIISIFLEEGISQDFTNEPTLQMSFTLLIISYFGVWLLASQVTKIPNDRVLAVAAVRILCIALSLGFGIIQIMHVIRRNYQYIYDNPDMDWY